MTYLLCKKRTARVCIKVAPLFCLEISTEMSLPNQRDCPRMRKNFVRLYRDLLVAHCAYGVKDAFRQAYLAKKCFEDYPFSPSEMYKELVAMCKFDYVQTLHSADPLKKMTKCDAPSTGPDPERRAQIMAYVETADDFILRDACMPSLLAHRTLYEMNDQLSSRPLEVDSKDPMKVLRNLYLRRKKYYESACEEELSMFDTMLRILIAI